jgi:lysophospholipase-3
MMPYDTFWNESEILVFGPDFNYTVADYKRFFTDVGFDDGFLMRQDTEHYIKVSFEPTNAVDSNFNELNSFI